MTNWSKHSSNKALNTKALFIWMAEVAQLGNYTAVTLYVTLIH